MAVTQNVGWSLINTKKPFQIERAFLFLQIIHKV